MQLLLSFPPSGNFLIRGTLLGGPARSSRGRFSFFFASSSQPGCGPPVLSETLANPGFAELDQKNGAKRIKNGGFGNSFGFWVFLPIFGSTLAACRNPLPHLGGFSQHLFFLSPPAPVPIQVLANREVVWGPLGAQGWYGLVWQGGVFWGYCQGYYTRFIHPTLCSGIAGPFLFSTVAGAISPALYLASWNMCTSVCACGALRRFLPPSLTVTFTFWGCPTTEGLPPDTQGLPVKTVALTAGLTNVNINDRTYSCWLCMLSAQKLGERTREVQ